MPSSLSSSTRRDLRCFNPARIARLLGSASVGCCWWTSSLSWSDGLTTDRSLMGSKLSLIASKVQAGRNSGLLARPWRHSSHYGDRRNSAHDEEDDEDNHHDSTALVQPREERPTQTAVAQPLSDVIPSKPKIVVLGATGKIGRLVVRQLLETTSLGEATIVAVVRDYDKACRVLYDDLVVAKRGRNKPRLQIIEGDLVPPEELPGFELVDDSPHDREQWIKRATSAATFYGNSVSDYDDKRDGNWEPLGNVALKEAITGCTVIISCVGTVRPTNVWTDFLARPFYRILHKDVRSWCRDPRHPFYVHYSTTQKALAYAEKEQMRRDAVIGSMDDEELEHLKRRSKSTSTRIRFVRISDLCVAQQPWYFIPLITNIMHSLVFRYHDMAERLLESSPHIDTFVIRPGDLCDDERNVTTTALQVDSSGSLPLPSRVGREDVAALAIASAFFREPDRSDANADRNQHSSRSQQGAKHHTLAVRWVGDQIYPYPPQGCRGDGHLDALSGLQAALQGKIQLTTAGINYPGSGKPLSLMACAQL